MAQGLALAIILYASMVAPMFLGDYPKGTPFLFKYKKKKRDVDNWDVQG